MKRLQLLLLWVWMVCFSAASHDYMFKHLEVKDGLSNNQVNAIYKDSNGFMWFGTASGLNRYDGYNIKIYRSQKDDEKSLPDSYVEDIQEDTSGNLWIRTGGGYAIYNSASDVFDRNVEAWMWNIGLTGNPSLIYIDKEKTFWIYINGKGVYSYREEQKNAVAVKGADELLAKAEVSDMKECGEGILLVLSNGILACIDEEKQNIKWTNPDIAEDCREVKNATFDLFVDHSGRAWIFSVEGMWIYSLSQKVWEQRSPRTDTYNTVRAVAQDKYGCIWVGRDQDGIELIEPAGRKIRLANDPNNGRTLSNNTITALYEDEAGTMWVGTYKKGVSFYNESVFKFGIADVGDINCVEDGGGDIVWVGTNDRGLIRWNSVTDERMFFSHTADPRSISSDVIVCLLRDSSGRVWAGTFWGGLNCYDGNRFIHYRSRKGDSNSLVYDNVWALAEDADKNIWIGTLGGGLQCLNPQTGIFTTYSTGNSNLVSDYISSLCISCDNNLIIGTSAGMAFMDLRTGEITNFAGTKSGKTRLSNQNINQVYEDSRGLLWIATREGLNVYDSKRDELYEVPIKPGFSKLLILGITEDENKSIWISTGGELINVVLSVDSKTEQPVFRCYTYNDKDGLQSCDFNQRSLKRLHTGEIVVGGLYGLNRFQPGNIKYNRTLPKVMFTGFQLFNEDVKVGKEYAGRVILKEALNETEEVVLAYKQNVFTVLFASDNFVLPEKTQYFYKLEGFNENWLTSMSDMHRVTYTNLAPGTYILRVKATNSDGYAGTEEASLKIVILPPFWMTPWAYIVYALLIVGVVFFSLYVVQRRERNKFRIRQIEEDAKKKEELSQMKFRFFTNVSHELRTPLTLIISPMESMMKEITDEKLHGKLQLMYRNAQRLLNLVNQLLDFRKNEMAGLHLTLSEGDIVAYVRNICSSFLMLSEKKHVHLTFFSAVEWLNMSFDEDKVGKIVMNLLSNAFKFTPENGRIAVRLSSLSKEDKRWIRFTVANTGSMISAEHIRNVFDRFYKIDMHHTGSGIGLALVKAFVEMHGGMISVESDEKQGTVFTVELPVQSCEAVAAEPDTTLVSADSRTTDVLLAEEEELEKGYDSSKPSVLIIDDNEDIRSYVHTLLHTDYTVIEAADGSEGIRKAMKYVPDLIISDVMMPGIDGIECCRRLKSELQTCHIPVILLTACSLDEQRIQGYDGGADSYISKPFSSQLLLARVRNLIDSHRRLKQFFGDGQTLAKEDVCDMDKDFVEKFKALIEAKMGDSNLNVEDLGKDMGLSRVQLYRKIKSLTNYSPNELLRIARLKKAASLLASSDMTVAEIGYEVGFSSPSYFTKCYREQFGESPTDLLKRKG